METSQCVKIATRNAQAAHEDRYPLGEELSDRETINIYGGTICQVAGCKTDFYDQEYDCRREPQPISD